MISLYWESKPNVLAIMNYDNDFNFLLFYTTKSTIILSLFSLSQCQGVLDVRTFISPLFLSLGTPFFILNLVIPKTCHNLFGTSRYFPMEGLRRCCSSEPFVRKGALLLPLYYIVLHFGTPKQWHDIYLL